MTSRRLLRPAGALLLAALFAGCSHTAPQPLISESDPAVQALNDSAQRVARAAEQAALAQSVSGAKRGRVTEEYRIDLSRLPAELREPLLLERGFHGELEVFVRSLADAIGWPAPVVFGNRPSTPLIVVMTEQRRPPIHWIADAGYQAGELASVRVNPGLRQIVIAYKEAGGVR